MPTRKTLRLVMKDFNTATLAEWEDLLVERSSSISNVRTHGEEFDFLYLLTVFIRQQRRGLDGLRAAREQAQKEAARLHDEGVEPLKTTGYGRS